MHWYEWVIVSLSLLYALSTIAASAVHLFHIRRDLSSAIPEKAYTWIFTVNVILQVPGVLLFSGLLLHLFRIKAAWIMVHIGIVLTLITLPYNLIYSLSPLPASAFIGFALMIVLMVLFIVKYRGEYPYTVRRLLAVFIPVLFFFLLSLYQVHLVMLLTRQA